MSMEETGNPQETNKSEESRSETTVEDLTIDEATLDDVKGGLSRPGDVKVGSLKLKVRRPPI